MSIRTISRELINKESKKISQIDLEDSIDQDSETLRRVDKVLSRLDQIENM